MSRPNRGSSSRCSPALNFQIWRVLLESSTAEEGARYGGDGKRHGERREMIATLQLQYNKARQGAITKELLEVRFRGRSPQEAPDRRAPHLPFTSVGSCFRRPFCPGKFSASGILHHRRAFRTFKIRCGFHCVCKPCQWMELAMFDELSRKLEVC